MSQEEDQNEEYVWGVSELYEGYEQEFLEVYSVIVTDFLPTISTNPTEFCSSEQCEDLLRKLDVLSKNIRQMEIELKPMIANKITGNSHLVEFAKMKKNFNELQQTLRPFHEAVSLKFEASGPGLEEDEEEKGFVSGFAQESNPKKPYLKQNDEETGKKEKKKKEKKPKEEQKESQPHVIRSIQQAGAHLDQFPGVEITKNMVAGVMADPTSRMRVVKGATLIAFIMLLFLLFLHHRMFS